ncbi:MAG: maltose alpha-D-glucosyltransferase [Acidobacteria bacterium]|nr:maltose alpha-D-glucosyltransferase [Acidobacteriota bacterium]
MIDPIASATDPLWFKDAIIYELHVRAFADSNGDGIGDFQGLIQKLDYIQELGVTCIWLLPFYPSPLKDDGYDIANYRDVHTSYGTLRDFRAFLREAHARGLRVFTELVVNHTSDQHPWFQAARRAAPGSAKRNFYVWSETAKEYADARIIFTDTETSNWTWDPVAHAYYWHRFFGHQPDLNYDNPHVRRAVIKVMRYWLDMGVDGLRLDAVPYLIERDGTNCENLIETHLILKALRKEVDAHSADRALLAEANQWPADVRPYFGDGDECHMAYHFPLMPRIFMAVKQEDAHPIVEILRQTPEIPPNCQWALFLRNHDELTLEMVTDEERDYMYTAYAADPQMRLNSGIRRRLAPLMEYSRSRIELLNSLLLSLPGSPIIYYGDELGMGDNVYLGDRNGVRTPMQWTGDRNAGFSRADPARLFAPPVMDPLYGYQAINVEAQERSPASLLNWMRRMLALRRKYRTFGRGSIDFIPTDNRRVLAYVREDEECQILVIANMARTVQPVHLDLSRFRNRHLVEMIGGTEFPPVGSDPYFLTIGPHSFYWFSLSKVAEPIVLQRPRTGLATGETLPALLVSAVWEDLFDSHARRVLERDALVTFLSRQRWFGGKARHVDRVHFVDWMTLRRARRPRREPGRSRAHPRGRRPRLQARCLAHRSRARSASRSRGRCRELETVHSVTRAEQLERAARRSLHAEGVPAARAGREPRHRSRACVRRQRRGCACPSARGVGNLHAVGEPGADLDLHVATPSPQPILSLGPRDRSVAAILRTGARPGARRPPHPRHAERAGGLDRRDGGRLLDHVVCARAAHGAVARSVGGVAR